MAYSPGFREELERSRSYGVSVQRQQAYAQAATPDVAANVAAISRSHPHLSPKVVTAAGLAGLRADDPSLMELSARSISKQKKEDGFLGGIGKIVTSPLRTAMRIAKPIADPMGGYAKTAIRGAMTAVETPFQVAGGMLRNVATMGGGGQGGEIGAGAIAGGAAGAAVGSVVPILGTAIGAAVGGVAGAIGGALADNVEGDWQNPLAQSSGGQVVNQWMKGENVDLGTGFFSGGQVHKDMLDRQRKAAMIDGHALTGGRLIADGYSRPGTTSYNIMSGMIDFATVAKFDPANLAGKELKLLRARRATILGKGQATLESPTVRFLQGKGVGIRRGEVIDEDTINKAGLVDAEAKLLDTKSAQEFLHGDRMKEVISDIAAETSPTRIRDLTGKKIRVDLARRLAKADNEADVSSILEESILRREITEKAALDKGIGVMGTVRAFRKKSRLAGWAAETTDRMRVNVPLGGIDLIDMDKAPEKLGRAVDYFDDFMNNAGFSKAERIEWTDQLAQVDNVADGHRVIEKWVVTELDGKLSELGWDTKTRNKVLGGYAKVRDEWREVIQDEFVSDGRLFSVKLDGDEFPVPKGNEVSEYIDNVIELPDVREVRRRTTTAWNLDPRRRSALAKADKLEADGYFDEAEELRGKYSQPKEMHVPGSETLFGKEINLSRKALYNNSLWRGGVAAMDHGMTQIWRPLTLLRPAWTMRIIIEEQARMAAQGMEVPIAHPFSLIVGMLTRPRGARGPTADSLDATGGLLSTSMQHQEVMASSATMGKEANLMSKHRKIYNANDDGFGNAWAGRLLLMHKDEIARRVARDGPQNTAAWIKSAEATAARERIASVLGTPGILDNAAAQEQHVYKVYQDVLDVTASDPEVINAIGTGRLKGYKSTTGGVTREGVSALSAPEQAAAVKQRLKELKRMQRTAKFSGRRDMTPFSADDIQRQMDDLNTRGYEALIEEEGGILLTRMDGKGIINPDVAGELSRRGRDPRIKTPPEVLGATEINPKHLKRMDRATEWMFSHFLSIPTDTLSRSPAFKQVYWKTVADNMGGLTPEAKQAVLRNAQKAGLSRKQEAYLKQGARRGGAGDMELEEADLLAKSVATDRIREIFDDMTKKGAFGDAARHIAPFGNAWKQATMQWARIFVEDPGAIRRLQLGTQAPRGFDPDGDGQGFFYKDDKGEWVFNYPGSELVAEHLPRIIPGGEERGVPFALQGKAAGMSMLSSSVLPGFGPMVSISASKILPTTPEYDDLRQLFAPYGDPTEQGAKSAVMPPWMKRVEQAFSDPELHRMQGDTMMDVMRYLQSTGKFDTSTPEGQEELYDAAKNRAKNLTLLRAAAQATGPAAPKIVPMAQDKNGDTVVAQLLIKDLAEMQKKDYNTATETFLEKYGDNAFLFLQAKTRARNPGVTNLDTDEGFDFARDNPELVELLPDTYGFFASQSEDPDNFNYTAWLRLIKTGEREVLTPKEQMALANDKVGAMKYYNIKDALGPKVTREQQAVLRQIKTFLQTKHPGFGTAKVGLAERAETPALMAELEQAVGIEKIAATPVGSALNRYLQIRKIAQQQAEARGRTSWTSSKDTADLRAVMRTAGSYLGSKTPGFSLLYDRVLANEFSDDDLDDVALPESGGMP